MDLLSRRLLRAVSFGVYALLGVSAFIAEPPARRTILLSPCLISAFLCSQWQLARDLHGRRRFSVWGGQAVSTLAFSLLLFEMRPAALLGIVWAGVQAAWEWPAWKGLALSAGWGMAAYFACCLPLAGTRFALNPADIMPIYSIPIVLSVLLSRQNDLRARDATMLDRSRATAAMLAQANLRLQEYAIQDQQMAIMAERTKMAREIYDTLGHTLTSILVQLGALQEMLHARTDLIPQQISSIEQTALEGLEEVGSAVDVLRAPAQERPRGRRLWERVATAFAEATGVRILFRIAEDFDWLPDGLSEAIYRIIQEGLTNAVRHGQASQVEISIRVQAGYLLVRISDDGKGAAGVIEGHGLRGMRERVAPFGGQVVYRSNPGYGFDLGIDIPLGAAERPAEGG